MVQSLDKDYIIPNLHLDSMDPQVLPYGDFLNVLTTPTPWIEPGSGQPRRASVNSFGFGGTNAHIIIEKYEPHIHNTVAYLFDDRLSGRLMRSPDLIPEAFSDMKITLPLVFSAASPKSLTGSLEQYAVFLKNDMHRSAELLAWHLFSRQTTHAARKVVIMDTENAADAMLALVKANTAGDQLGSIIQGRQLPRGSCPKILGIFPGQGAQYAAMSKGLFYTNSVYRDTIKVLDSVLQVCPEPPTWSLLEELMKSPGKSLIHTAEISQVLCCALQVGLVDFLNSLGVTFTCVLGHSSGEIGAAYAAGRITATPSSFLTIGGSTHIWPQAIVASRAEWLPVVCQRHKQKTSAPAQIIWEDLYWLPVTHLPL